MEISKSTKITINEIFVSHISHTYKLSENVNITVDSKIIIETSNHSLLNTTKEIIGAITEAILNNEQYAHVIVEDFDFVKEYIKAFFPNFVLLKEMAYRDSAALLLDNKLAEVLSYRHEVSNRRLEVAVFRYDILTCLDKDTSYLVPITFLVNREGLLNTVIMYGINS